MTRAGQVSVVLAGCFGVLVGCVSQEPACSPANFAAIQAAYSAKVLAACQEHEFDDCPALPALKAWRAEQERAGGCR